jgi:hypothetical protein
VSLGTGAYLCKTQAHPSGPTLYCLSRRVLRHSVGNRQVRAAIARSVALQLAQIARAKRPRYKILELYYQHGTKLAFNRCIAPVESEDVRNVKATNFRIGFVSNIWYSLRQHLNAHTTLHRLK